MDNKWVFAINEYYNVIQRSKYAIHMACQDMRARTREARQGANR